MKIILKSYGDFMFKTAKKNPKIICLMFLLSGFFFLISGLFLNTIVVITHDKLIGSLGLIPQLFVRIIFMVFGCVSCIMALTFRSRESFEYFYRQD